jgi:hypothetical protein
MNESKLIGVILPLKLVGIALLFSIVGNAVREGEARP